MQNPPKNKKIQSSFHPQNRHQGQYDFERLVQADDAHQEPRLRDFVIVNQTGNPSINFTDPTAVKALNRALLKDQYGIAHWDIPDGNLCPPIPGRADYLHYLADLLQANNHKKPVKHQNINVLDIGTGANGIYPLLGASAFGWHFVAVDISSASLENLGRIIASNPHIEKQIKLRHQADTSAVFRHIIRDDEWFDLSMCNPPFHASMEEANAGTNRKWENLGQAAASARPVLNFGGVGAELWCPGGEARFIRNMIQESVQFKTQCFWFSCLVSKAANVPELLKELSRAQALQVKTITMQQGQKQSRFLAWTFLNPTQQVAWAKLRW